MRKAGIHVIFGGNSRDLHLCFTWGKLTVVLCKGSPGTEVVGFSSNGHKEFFFFFFFCS